jgi:hypothetical protein
MLNTNQQRHVWEEWLGSEMRALYFADLAGSLYRRQRVVTWAALFTSSGAVIGFLVTHAVAWLAPSLATASAALSLYNLVAQDQQRAIEGTTLHYRWNKMARGYETLWSETWAPDAVERLAALDEEAAEISKAGALFPYQEKRMLRWQEHVERQRVGDAVAA